MTRVKLSKADIEFSLGASWGYSDASHPSGVATHASHRDPEGWAEQSAEWQDGYQKAWDRIQAGEGEVNWREMRR